MLIADLPAAGTAADADTWRTTARLCECTSCGQFQTLPSLVPGQTLAACDAVPCEA